MYTGQALRETSMISSTWIELMPWSKHLRRREQRDCKGVHVRMSCRIPHGFCSLTMGWIKSKTQFAPRPKPPSAHARDVLTCHSALPFAARMRCSMPEVCLRLTFSSATTGEVIRDVRDKKLVQVQPQPCRARMSPFAMDQAVKMYGI